MQLLASVTHNILNVCKHKITQKSCSYTHLKKKRKKHTLLHTYTRMSSKWVEINPKLSFKGKCQKISIGEEFFNHAKP